MNDIPKLVELIERIETLDVNSEIANRIRINKQTIIGITLIHSEYYMLIIAC